MAGWTTITVDTDSEQTFKDYLYSTFEDAANKVNEGYTEDDVLYIAILDHNPDLGADETVLGGVTVNKRVTDAIEDCPVTFEWAVVVEMNDTTSVARADFYTYAGGETQHIDSLNEREALGRPELGLGVVAYAEKFHNVTPIVGNGEVSETDEVPDDAHDDLETITPDDFKHEFRNPPEERLS